MEAQSRKADADVIVVGAGPGGLMTALGLARSGRQVLVVERKERELLGRPIRVSVEASVFAACGLPEPRPPVRLTPPLSREFISPDNKHRLKVRHLPVVQLDLRGFLAGLLDEAEGSGVRFLFETVITGPIHDGSGRVAGAVGTSPDGRMLELVAPLTVDASGIAAAVRHQLDPETIVPREISPADVCNAWQAAHELDRGSVMELLQRNRIRPQVDVLRVGFMGGYSMLSVYVDMEADRLELTAGLAHDPSYPTAREVVEGYAASHHWIGDPISAGGGLIPVRRPLDSLVADGFACVGDAACQALPQHASGIASALHAGKILAEVAATALEQGDLGPEALWPYNARYMQTRGAVQANSDLYRKFLMQISADELSALFALGLVTEEGVCGSLEGLALELPKSALLSAGLRLLDRPRLLLRLYRISRSVIEAVKLYERYPGRYDAVQFEKWRAEAERLFA